MFRGKESSNRIKLSRLVQDLLNFGVLGSLQLWLLDGVGVVGEWGWLEGAGVVGSGGGLKGWGWFGCAPHTCTCMHIYTLNMIISITNGESLGVP